MKQMLVPFLPAVSVSSSFCAILSPTRKVLHTCCAVLTVWSHRVAGGMEQSCCENCSEKKNPNTPRYDNVNMPPGAKIKRYYLYIDRELLGGGGK